MELLDYLAAQPNEATTLLLETPGYSYPGFICGLKSSLGDDIRNIDERWLRDLRDPKLHKAYDFYSRPHRALGKVAPAEFIRQLGVCCSRRAYTKPKTNIAFGPEKRVSLKT